MENDLPCWQKKAYLRSFILAFLILACLAVTFYFHFIMATEIVFTHLFYIPVILSAIWWGWRGVLVPLFLGGALLLSHALSGLSFSYMSDITRAVMFISVGLITNCLWSRCLRTERDLVDTLKLVDNFIGDSNCPMLIADKNSRVTMFNRAFEEMSGLSHEDFLGKPIELIFAEKDRSSIRQTMSGDYPGPIEASVNCINGHRATCLWTASNIYSPDHKTFLGAMVHGQDITKRKTVEELMMKHAEELKILNSRCRLSESHLKELNAAKDKFFSILSHDLRTPFHCLLTYASVLKDEAPRISRKKTEEFAQVIHRHSERLFHLVENLLDWSRIQDGKMEPLNEPLNLADLVRENVGIIKAQAQQKKINLLTEGIEDCLVFADRGQINCIIRNLVSNGIKFTKAGGTVKIITVKEGERVKLIVSDTGVGISREFIDLLFRIDVYHSTAGTDKEKGTGLGLVICKEIAVKNGGTIDVESSPGKGSTFTVTLPAYSASLLHA